ncbi:MAG: PilZ domain-containing protein [Acidobacteria bacterium]|nr:PilZ domain-containing protein [Acidobacteriota bacterium]MBV8892064.1 PilZ domain-containing protein [Acidobacteriota bacterium]MBV9480687.1 PilZ domain-containing protein [Acidobacteriota bacterium]
MKATFEKRAARRKKMVVPLKSLPVGNAQATHSAVHTLDVSRLGAKLGAFRELVEPGDVLVVQRQHKRAKCKVVWVREIGPREIQVGIEFLGSAEGFWGLPLEDEDAGVWVSEQL